MKIAFPPIALAAALLAALPAFAAGSRTDADTGMSGSRQSTAAITRDPAAIRKVQKALSDEGYDVQANGKWDNATRSALREFQEDNGLKATGKLNAKTVQKLGLSDQGEFSAFEQEEGIEDRDLSKPESSATPDSSSSDVTREAPRNPAEGDTGHSDMSQ